MFSVEKRTFSIGDIKAFNISTKLIENLLFAVFHYSKLKIDVTKPLKAFNIVEVFFTTITLQNLFKKALPLSDVNIAIDFNTESFLSFSISKCPDNRYYTKNSNCLTLKIKLGLLDNFFETDLHIDFRFINTLSFSRIFVNEIYLTNPYNNDHPLIKTEETLDFFNDLFDLVVGALNNVISQKIKVQNTIIGTYCSKLNIHTEEESISISCKET